MQKTLVVTIDTEPDNQWDVEGRRRCSLSNLRALPALQDIFDRYDVRPTYLVCYGVVDKRPAASILNEILISGRCEIGAHMHPWNTPPITADECENAAYPHRLPQELEHEKIAALTGRIRDVFGIIPTSYRAGRGGFDGGSLHILESLGYVVDTSIMPTQNPRFHGCGLLTPISLEPYFPDYEKVCLPGESCVLEVPMTASVVGRRRYELNLPWRKRLGVTPVDHLLRKLGWAKINWLRPSWCSASEMIELCDEMLAKESCVLNMMFHSSELLPGTSPYVRTQKAVENLLEGIDAVLRHLVENQGVRSVTLTEFALGWIERTRPELLRDREKITF